MDKKKVNYFKPDNQFIIVKKFTKEIINEGIEANTVEDVY